MCGWVLYEVCCLTSFLHHPCADNALHKPSCRLPLSYSRVSPATSRGDLESVGPKWKSRGWDDHKMERHASKQRVTVNRNQCPREAPQSVWNIMRHQAQQPAGSTAKAAHCASIWGSWETALHASPWRSGKTPWRRGQLSQAEQSKCLWSWKRMVQTRKAAWTSTRKQGWEWCLQHTAQDRPLTWLSNSLTVLQIKVV